MIIFHSVSNFCALALWIGQKSGSWCDNIKTIYQWLWTFLKYLLSYLPPPPLENGGWVEIDSSIDSILVLLVGGIPHTRRSNCAKIKISQSDFRNLKFGKRVNISGDWILMLAEYKNGRNMQLFQIVTDCRRIGKKFIFQGFCYKRSKKLLHLTEWQLVLFKNWLSVATVKKLAATVEKLFAVVEKVL